MAEEEHIRVHEQDDYDGEVLSAELDLGIERVNQQMETLHRFSSEGIRMFRVLILFVAAPATILGRPPMAN